MGKRSVEKDFFIRNQYIFQSGRLYSW